MVNTVRQIAILHASFKTHGGGEELSLSVAKALADEFEVTIYTAESPDRIYVERTMPELSEIFNRVSFVVKGSRIARILEASGNLVRLWSLLDVDLYIEEAVNSGAFAIIETFTSMPVAPVVYFHYPVPINTSSLTGRLYESIVRLGYRRLMSKIGGVKLALANSTWTAEGVKRDYNIHAEVLYPPINSRLFFEAAKGPHNENVVVTVSRLGLGKQLDFIVDVAARMRDYEFYLVGKSQRDTPRLISLIKTKAESLHANNIHILIDLPEDELVEIMSKAKAYLHPLFAEHFGIAVAKAIAAGLPAVVYRDGGSWTDIVSRIDPLLGYTNIDETVKALKYAIDNRDTLASKGVKLAKQFSFNAFREKLKSYIMRLIT